MPRTLRQTALVSEGAAHFTSPSDEQVAIVRVESPAIGAASQVEVEADITQSFPISAPGADVAVSFGVGLLGADVRVVSSAEGEECAVTWLWND